MPTVTRAISGLPDTLPVPTTVMLRVAVCGAVWPLRIERYLARLPGLQLNHPPSVRDHDHHH